MLQNAAVLNASCGSVSACIRRAVPGSKESGMQEKSAEFLSSGAHVYLPVSGT